MVSSLAIKMVLSVFLLSLLLSGSLHTASAFSISATKSTSNSILGDNFQTNSFHSPDLRIASLLNAEAPSSGATVAAIEDDSQTVETAEQPQVMASGFSQNMDMLEALQEAVEMALASLPPPQKNSGIDLAVVSVSSLYDGNSSPSLVVPTVLSAASNYGKGIQHLVGSTCGGFIGSTLGGGSESAEFESNDDNSNENDEDLDTQKKKKVSPACVPVEREGVPGVSIVLSILPDVQLGTFHVTGDEVPDDYENMPSEQWKKSIGLSSSQSGDENDGSGPAVMAFPSPAMSNELDDFLRGMETHIPGCNIFGSVASTVSSLSRARLFRYDAKMENSGDSVVQTLADGCVGVVMDGDITVQTMMAKGAKPVGGVYNIVKGEGSTISAVALDEAATELVVAAEELDEEEEEEDDDEDYGDDERKAKRAKMAAAYAKARIPKPVLAEANFVMKTLSDDDQAFMRKFILVGLERPGSRAGTPSELTRLTEGKGHGYAVHQVASASMKDGSVTLSLGSVDIEQGTRMRFFVRESDFAKKEVEALWRGYKKRRSKSDGDSASASPPTGCFIFPTLDRGSKFFSGKPGFEGSTVSKFLPSVPCVSGFFGNGVIGSMSADPELPSVAEEATMSGSATGYFLIGSKSNRPIYSPGKSGAYDTDTEEKESDATEELMEERKSLDLKEKKAPRDENGELILRRREVSSGRAMTVSTVEWSVAENMATPTSSLEGFMWDKETEVDRFRERVPLANLLSQCKLSMVDPSKPKPRDWIGPVKDAASKNRFVVLPDFKRTEPGSGSLRKRYDVSKLAREFTAKGVSAISVNCDSVLFGGSLEDLTKVREASAKATIESSTLDDGVNAPPILASDLILYPYQLYKMRLAGADAVNLIVGALATKDLVYLTKIASSLQMQSMLTVTSVTQVENLKVLPTGSIGGLLVSNRELEDFSFDMTGRQALDILQSSALRELKEKHGDDIPILVEGRVGIIRMKDENGKESSEAYIKELRDAGATGAVVGGGLVSDEFDLPF